jgi:hypothetical protein
MARKKKTLLTEGEMRRFMKLANIAPIQEMGGMYPGARDEKERDEKDPMTEQEDEEVEMDMGMDMGMDMDAPEADMPDMDEPEMDMAGGDSIELEDFVRALEKALEDVTGQEVTTDVDMDTEDDEAPPEGGDIEMDMDVEMPDAGGEEEDMDMDLMAERIARRVRRRIMKENSKKSNKAKALKEARIRRKRMEERADRLTNKIFARIMKESR